MRRITSYLVAVILANLFTQFAFAQNTTISGNVQNSVTTEKSAAVSVTVKGSDQGTYTDDKGNFSINVKSLPATLRFSSVGYATQEILVTSA